LSGYALPAITIEEYEPRLVLEAETELGASGPIGMQQGDLGPSFAVHGQPTPQRVRLVAKKQGSRKHTLGLQHLSKIGEFRLYSTQALFEG
jgi:hypothetical protein